jgi:hypothetical protein
MDGEKERLEKELRFLKESLEASIISEEEYGKGKARIEKRLDEIGAKAEDKDEKLTVDDINDFWKEEKEETAADILKEVEEEEKEGETKKMPEDKKVEQEDWVTKELKELGEEKLVETKPKNSEPKPEPKPEPEKKKEEKPKASKPKPEPKPDPETSFDSEEEKKPVAINRKTLRIIAVIAIIIMFILIRRAPNDGPTIPLLEEEAFEPVCSADEECIETGRVGICKNPGTEEAACEFLEPQEVKLTVIDDKTCTSCNTIRTLNILKQLFPGVKKTTIDANTPNGRAFINEFGIKVLPAYIFDAEIEETMKFDKFKRALVKKGDNYLVTPTASGSNYLFSRPSRPAAIELFVEADQDTTIIDNSMGEVVGLFGSKMTFSKQIVKESDKAALKRELAINTFPAYLINNQLKFTGTQAPEIIKRRFCDVNSLPECEATLSLVVIN